ncbi:MAG: hypothetical protein M3014_15610, partial [Chloroflexota bacterium]|nr:hypothetical protein [Chloroflexota bacterium]
MTRVVKSRSILALLLLVTVLAVTSSTKDTQQANSTQAGTQAAPAPLMPSGAGQGSITGSAGDAANQAYQTGKSPVTVLPNGGEVRSDVKHDVSPPLRSIPAQPPGTAKRSREIENSLAPGTGRALGRDLALQTLYGHLAIPTPIANFEGQYNYAGVIPPDTNGDVGPTYYVQTVNTTVQVFNKTTGASVFGPVDIKTLFTGFGGTCEARNDGDPIVLYDQFADRWQISQFTAPPGPYYQCIALSTSGDPTGSYYRYAFQTSMTNFEDYPHLGVWPDAYYMATNEFANGTANVGAGFFAFERSKMLVGQAARQIMFTRPVPEGGYLPSDADGFNPPAAGTPNFFMAPNRQLGNAVRQYRFQIVAWDPAPVANLLGPIDIPVTAFAAPSTAPQPNTAVRLDNLADRFMHRLAYRNFGDHESLVVNHTVDAGSGRG